MSPMPTPTTRPERMICAWIPGWALIAAGADPDVPCATTIAGAISMCSRPAAESGVRRGMRTRDAQRLCPELELYAADPAREARLFEPVVLAMETIVAGVEVARPGLCLLRAAGPSRFYRGETNAATALRDAIADADVDHPGGLPAGIGVADGPFAAGLAARTDAIVEPGDAPAFLAGFDLAVLDRPVLARTLHRLGIRTLGDYAALPADSIAARFGADGIAAHRLARGLDARPPAPRLPPSDLTVAADLDPPAQLVEQAMFTAKRLADQLHQNLARLGMVCERVEIGAATADGAESIRWWRHGGDLSSNAVAERARWQLDGWTTSRQLTHPRGEDGDPDVYDHGFVRLWLRPDGLQLGGATQRTLFGPEPLGDAAEAAIERLQALLGHAAITRPVLLGGRDPAGRVIRVPFGDLIPDSRGDGPWPGRIPDPPPARIDTIPVQLLDTTGRPITVSGRGELSAPPARIVIGTAKIAIVGFSDVWIAAERTWDPHRADRRARLQVALADGTAYLVAVHSGTWSIIASYQ